MRTARSACFAVMALVTAAACGDEDMRPAADSNAGGAAASAGTTAQGGTPGAGGTTGTVDPRDFLGCDACGPLGECFQGERCVAKLVRLPQGFGIDATEVTRGQYMAWLATGPTMAGQPGKVCLFNTNYTPGCEWPPGDGRNLPVVCVDYCDAFMYCKLSGKRLCGSIGGGEAPYGEPNSETGQWYMACTSGGVNRFPYGNVYYSEICNTADSSHGIEPVANRPFCEGPPGVFDLSGNVGEWENTCSAGCTSGDRGPRDYARPRGGSYQSGEVSVDCGLADGEHQDQMIGDGMDGTGFRCCSL